MGNSLKPASRRFNSCQQGLFQLGIPRWRLRAKSLCRKRTCRTASPMSESSMSFFLLDLLSIWFPGSTWTVESVVIVWTSFLWDWDHHGLGKVPRILYLLRCIRCFILVVPRWEWICSLLHGDSYINDHNRVYVFREYKGSDCWYIITDRVLQATFIRRKYAHSFFFAIFHLAGTSLVVQL